MVGTQDLRIASIRDEIEIKIVQNIITEFNIYTVEVDLK
jgi:hypothetical protein